MHDQMVWRVWPSVVPTGKQEYRNETDHISVSGALRRFSVSLVFGAALGSNIIFRTEEAGKLLTEEELRFGH